LGVKVNVFGLEILIVGKISWFGEIGWGWRFGLFDDEGFFG